MNIKFFVTVFALLISLSISCCVAPPKIPASLETLPPDITREILRIAAIENGTINTQILAQGILSTIATNKVLRAAINNSQNILSILRMLEDHEALDLAKRLKIIQTFKMVSIRNGLCTTLTMKPVQDQTRFQQDQEIQDWLKVVQKRLDRNRKLVLLYDIVKSNSIEKRLMLPVCKDLLYRSDATDLAFILNSKDENGLTLLMFAVIQNNIELVDYFIALGANINAQANNGWTALMYACDEGDIEMVNYLLNAGADSNIRNNQDALALDIVRIRRYSEIIMLLEE